MRYYYAMIDAREIQPGGNLRVFASKALRDEYVRSVPKAYPYTSRAAYYDMCDWCDVPLFKIPTDALVHRFALTGGDVNFDPES